MAQSKLKSMFFVLGFIASTIVWLSASYFRTGTSSVHEFRSDVVGDVYKNIALEAYASENNITLKRAKYLRTPIVAMTDSAAYVELRANEGIIAHRVTYVFDLNSNRYREKKQFQFFREHGSDVLQAVDY